MALYVMRPPDPPAGVDWLTAVPGEYLYNVTGITATLVTAAGNPNIAVDASGNHNNAAYFNAWTHHVPGWVVGDDAAQATDQQEFLQSAPPAFDFTNDYTFECWCNRADPAPNLIPFSVIDTMGSVVIKVTIMGTNSNGDGDPAGAVRVEMGGHVGAFVSPAGIWSDPGPHLLEISVAPGIGTLLVGIDGAIAYGITVAPWVPFAPPQSIFWAGGQLLANTVWDELALYPFAFGSGEMLNQLLNAAAGFATYNAGTLALGPSIYYHLDDPVAGAGRQALLNITDATHRVLLVPTGFAAGPNPGTYAYSWQPRLAASSQTPDQLFTTIAMPALVLPAGYSIGTNTPDLAPSDQWSNVAIWWDSNIMDAQAGLGAYLFPPPVHLVYHQEPH